MANVSWGLKALVTVTRSLAGPGRPSKLKQELIRKHVNENLDPAHKLDEAAFNAIFCDLDHNPIANRPESSTGEKKRDDVKFDRVVEEAFKAFRDQEREITLNAPEGTCVEFDVCSRTDDRPSDKFWTGAAHLRHHLEFLLVLKEVKPCVLFFKFAPENKPLFSTVVVDCLIPIMDRFDLWSYGFRISVENGSWVFYDARSPKMPLINKVFLTNRCLAKEVDRVAHPDKDCPRISDRETAEALGYPIPFDDWRSGRDVTMRDVTELNVLASIGWPEGQRCCVAGMSFTCPAGDYESGWKKLLGLYRQCQEVAKSVGTDLVLSTAGYHEMNDWLEKNADMLDGLSWESGSPRIFGGVPFTLEQITKLLGGADQGNMTVDDLNRLLGGLCIMVPVPKKNVEESNDSV